MKDKRVAITGGAGFIDSHLAGELATRNSVIILIDVRGIFNSDEAERKGFYYKAL